MNRFQVTLLSSLLISSTYLNAFEFGIGPFGIRFGAPSVVVVQTPDNAPSQFNNRNTREGTLCYAISNQKRVELIVEGSDIINSKEKRIVTKKLIVEPYVLGLTKDGQMALNGAVVEEQLVKEVTVKYGDEQFDDVKAKERPGIFSGFFRSEKNDLKDLDIRDVSSINVIEDSHFEAPNNFKNIIGDEIVQVICHVKKAS